MDYGFLYGFSDLIEGIHKNNLDKTKGAIEQLNSYQSAENSDTLIDDFITEFDVFQLFKNNESFLYFLNNYKTENKNTKRGMWKAKSNIMTENFQKGLIDKEILNNYIQESILSLNTNNNGALDEDNYKYLDLIRLSLMTKNYDFIFNELKPKFYVEGET